MTNERGKNIIGGIVDFFHQITVELMLMEVTITLIRGANTKYGKEGRILGKLDHPAHRDCIKMLCSNAKAGKYPEAQMVFSSPFARSLESARTIYPGAKIIELAQLTGFDYGIFAGKSYGEIIADKRFETWTSSQMLTELPGGEPPYVFLSRCAQALQKITGYARKSGLKRISVVTHQLVIGAMLQRGNMPGCLYYDYHSDYGGGFIICHKEERGGLSILKKL